MPTTHRSASVSPAALVVLGSMIIAWSGIFVGLADLTPATAAFLRCAYAVPPLIALAWWWRRSGRASAMTRRQLIWSTVAGLSFAADLVLWHICIDAVGAGLATVLGNTQVFLFPLFVWIAWRETPTRRQLLVLPVLLVGIVLISGIAGTHAFGNDPVLGVITGLLTGVAYAGFLLAMRGSAPDNGAIPVAPLMVATAVAAIGSALIGLATSTLDAAPTWPAHGWMLLLALSCQVLAWMLITGSLTRVRAARVSMLLLIQPVTALVLGVLVLGEQPSAAQWIGSAVLLGGVVWGNTAAAVPPPAAPAT